MYGPLGLTEFQWKWDSQLAVLSIHATSTPYFCAAMVMSATTCVWLTERPLGTMKLGRGGTARGGGAAEGAAARHSLRGRGDEHCGRRSRHHHQAAKNEATCPLGQMQRGSLLSSVGLPASSPCRGLWTARPVLPPWRCTSRGHSAPEPWPTLPHRVVVTATGATGAAAPYQPAAAPSAQA